jgi:membrane dipeptidase
MQEAGLAGAVLSVATNPFRRRPGRTATLVSNLSRLRKAAASAGVDVVGDLAGYRAARAAGRMACFLAVQGGNAFGAGAIDVSHVPEPLLTRVTLLHLTDSPLGSTSSPLGPTRGRRGLTPAGAELVAALNDRRVLVDLAHISRPGFWQALDAHDRDLPPVVSHTGVCGAHDSWRNLDDDQIRAIAGRGGVVGVMYHRGFLGRPSWKVGADAVAAHLEHIVNVGGEDAAALGSDWDGMIVTPRDMPTVLELPVLVDCLLRRGVPEVRITKILGANYLRVMGAVRPGGQAPPSPGRPSR